MSAATKPVTNSPALKQRLARYGALALVFILLAGAVGYYFLGQTLAQSSPEDCFASPGACGYPDPNYNNDVGSSAVGVADCNALPDFSTSNLPPGTFYSGSGSTLEITDNDVTISNLNMGSFNIYVAGGVNNFTFENSCIATGDGTENSVGIIIASGATNTTIKDATISGASTNVASSTVQSGNCVPDAGISNGALGIAVDNNGTDTTINGVYTYNTGGGAPGAGGGTGTTVENSYELINTVPACEHDEGVYFSDGTVTLDHNVFLNQEDQTAAVFGDTFAAGACDNHLTMLNNLVAGGDYVIYPCGNATSVGTSTSDIEGNRFARCLTVPLINNNECSGEGLNGADSHGYYPIGGFFNVAADYYTGSGQTWSGNYWDDNLDQVNIDGSAGPPVTNPGPTVAITAPSRGTTARGTLAITATASTATPATVHDVQFQIDGINIPNCDPTSPASGSTYVCSTWDTAGSSNGSHTIQAIVNDSNGQTASSSEAVTVNNSAPSFDTIWNPSATPVNPDTTSDSSALELGTKFQSNEAGYILGVRFYKGVDNTGVHTGSLWTSGGTRVSTVTFANETASGWQQAFFPSPIAISANTTYVISYFAPNGNYAADHNYFDSAVTNGPLTALQNNDSGGDGGNGVFNTGSTFPNQSFAASNYWVDAVFSTSQYTAPTVSLTAPASGAAVNGIIPVTAAITANAGATITTVQFQADGANIPNCDPTTPTSGSTYECSTWDTTTLDNGNHSIAVMATDSNGQSVTIGEPVTIDNPTPAVTISANPTIITSGSTSNLTWNSSNASACTASGAWSGSVATSNTSGYAVSPTATSTYTLTCSGSGGISSPASATVTVTPPSATSPTKPSGGTASGSSSSASASSAAVPSQTTATTPSATTSSTASPAGSTEPATNNNGNPAQPANQPKSSQSLAGIQLISAVVLGILAIVGICIVLIRFRRRQA